MTLGSGNLGSNPGPGLGLNPGPGLVMTLESGNLGLNPGPVIRGPGCKFLQ